MKGFVPVTKDALSAMLKECLSAIEDDFKEKYFTVIDNYVVTEEKRSSVRRWYRLWLLPKPRFDTNRLESVEAYSANIKYGLFEACPLRMLKRDKQNSIEWVNSLKRIATSKNAGEPILLDIKTFKRISTPINYNWVNSGIYRTMRD